MSIWIEKKDRQCYPGVDWRFKKDPELLKFSLRTFKSGTIGSKSEMANRYPLI
jgi:hypothetical protein